jgi:phosphoenolpyruvate phosphomutase
MSGSPRSRLQVRRGEFLKIGGAHDALSAVLLERAGFPALWVSGFALSAAQFAMPDVNLVTMTESVEATRRIAESVDVPVIVDADNGFGDATNTMRAVREYGLAGAAGVCIEDNTFPKRCSLYPGAPRELVSLEEMCEKLAAARRAADPFGIVVIGRVESLIADLGSDDAIRRANAYAEAGADLILIHSKSFAPLREIALSGKLTKPLIVVPTLFPETCFRDMAACGIAGAIYANQMLRSMVRACSVTAEELLSAGSLADMNGSLSTVADINRLVKVPTGWSESGPQQPASNGRTMHGPDLRVHGPTLAVSAHAR